ncbi:MAG: SPASM domain-containing protein [Anaeromyxobacter sp.]|nr:SPASM domain-containing protein [Anaeromyxobacter sp.]
MGGDFSVTTDHLSTRLPHPAGPWRLTLVTDPDDCTLACDMCECGQARAAAGPRAGPPRRMDPALALSALAQLRGGALREVIPSTMGEPLLWAGFDALLDALAATRLRLNLTTSGTWPGRGAAAWGARLYPLASDVKVSWNGATAATAEAIMAGLDFAAAIEGVRQVAAARDEAAARTGVRGRLSFQVTAQAGNVDELPDLVRLAGALGVDRVKVNQLQPRAPHLLARALTRSAAGLARWNRAAAAARAAAAEVRRPAGPLELAGCGELALDPAAPAPLGPCPFVGREAWLLPDGRLAPCPHPAAWRGELGDFGSAAASPLRELWTSRAFRTFTERHEEHPVCAACPLRRPGGA